MPPVGEGIAFSVKWVFTRAASQAAPFSYRTFSFRCSSEAILPRTVYQDIRRVRTLAWAVTGLCLTHTVRLGAWAEVTQSRAQYAASRVRRLARWLHHPAIHPQQWYQPVLQAALVDWQPASRLYVALDTTALTPFVLIRASLVYGHRAIPLAWRAMRHKSTQVSFEAYQPVLDQVRALVPPDQGVRQKVALPI